MTKYARVVFEIEIKDNEEEEEIVDMMNYHVINTDIDIQDIEIHDRPYIQDECDSDVIESKNEESKEEEFTRKATEHCYAVIQYSGRGMFGRECPAVVVNNPEDFIAEIGMKGLKVDSMGLQYVVYTG